jgi:hypothetical protein
VFIRTKQISDGHRSDFSDAISFTTPNIFVQAPTISISGNLSGLVLTPTISLSAFSVFNGSDTHVSTDYQVVNKATGAVKWESLGNTVDKLSITTGQLDIQTEYTFRARVNGQTYGSSSWVEIDGTTVNIYVENPTITVDGAPSDVKKNPKITLSAFSVFNGTDTLELSDYQVIKAENNNVRIRIFMIYIFYIKQAFRSILFLSMGKLIPILVPRIIRQQIRIGIYIVDRYWQ